MAHKNEIIYNKLVRDRIPEIIESSGKTCTTEILSKGGYTDKEAERNILSNPFNRFEDMNMMHHTKTLGIIEVDSTVWKKLSEEDKKRIEEICDNKLIEYYNR